MPARKLGLPRDVPEELAQGWAAVRAVEADVRDVVL